MYCQQYVSNAGIWRVPSRRPCYLFRIFLGSTSRGYSSDRLLKGITSRPQSSDSITVTWKIRIFVGGEVSSRLLTFVKREDDVSLMWGLYHFYFVYFLVWFLKDTIFPLPAPRHVYALGHFNAILNLYYMLHFGTAFFVKLDCFLKQLTIIILDYNDIVWWIGQVHSTSAANGRIQWLSLLRSLCLVQNANCKCPYVHICLYFSCRPRQQKFRLSSDSILKMHFIKWNAF